VKGIIPKLATPLQMIDISRKGMRDETQGSRQQPIRGIK